ncbi:MAG: dihydropteroate synthase [Oscillospiraceae bacterium]|nr:dihydropteroate synthase [Oscillospiraceae bacterium]
MFSFKDLYKNKPLVMGILNITPDSFSDGGEADNFSGALEKLHALEEEGADIIDIGACSTAPFNTVIDVNTELERLSFLPELVKNASVPLSIDTLRPEVADYALSVGVSIVNDETGAFTDEMAEVVKKYNAGWVFMHTGGVSSKEVKVYPNGVTEEVLDFFKSMKEQAVAVGINEDALCYDCGIGFGKSRNDDVRLLTDCKKLSEYSPLLIGVSRKRVIGEITGAKNPKDRAIGSSAAACICAYNGAGILRVHDVKETVEAIKVACAIYNGRL